MLTQIELTNFITIKQLSLDIASGLTVITGETGAGKSLLIDAIQLALGARMDNPVVGPFGQRCDITLTFDINHHPQAITWLEEQALDSDGECILRRTITTDNRSKLFINGISSTAQMVKTLGLILMNIHSQHQHQTLTKSSYQCELVDQYANNQTLRQTVGEHYQQWLNISNQITEISGHENREAEIELLNYQTAELDTLGLKPNETDTLSQQYKTLVNAEQLLTECENIRNLLCSEQNSGAQDLLGQASRSVAQLSQFDQFKPVGELIHTASIQLEEALNEIQTIADQVDINPELLETTNQRLDSIHQLARKHHCQPADLMDKQAALHQKLAAIVNSEDALNQLQQQLIDTESSYHTAAATLAQDRQAAAKGLAEQVSKQLGQLGMTNARFEISVEKNQNLGPNGLDKITFLISANPGQPLQPMSKVASGGELSRISLAIHVTATNASNQQTLIFDEVDVGIGGGIAEIVGKLLKQLGATSQILCITHLPQVAAQGNQHWQVKKQTDGQQTTSDIQPLNNTERTQEIARMLGGVNITQQTLAHAEEMLTDS